MLPRPGRLWGRTLGFVSLLALKTGMARRALLVLVGLAASVALGLLLLVWAT
jgi:hypothetical protein